MIAIINKEKIYNNCYYVRLNNCPKELLDEYDYPINYQKWKLKSNIKKIKQINPITGKECIFESLSDVTINCGISSKLAL